MKIEILKVNPNTNLKMIQKVFYDKNGLIINHSIQYKFGIKLKNYLKLPFLDTSVFDYKVESAFYCMLGDYYENMNNIIEQRNKCIDIMINKMGEFFQYKCLDKSVWKYFDGTISDDDIGYKELFSVINNKNILIIMDRLDLNIIEDIKFTYEIKSIKVILLDKFRLRLF